MVSTCCSAQAVPERTKTCAPTRAYPRKPTPAPEAPGPAARSRRCRSGRRRRCGKRRRPRACLPTGTRSSRSCRRAQRAETTGLLQRPRRPRTHVHGGQACVVVRGSTRGAHDHGVPGHRNRGPKELCPGLAQDLLLAPERPLADERVGEAGTVEARWRSNVRRPHDDRVPGDRDRGAEVVVGARIGRDELLRAPGRSRAREDVGRAAGIGQWPVVVGSPDHDRVAGDGNGLTEVIAGGHVGSGRREFRLLGPGRPGPGEHVHRSRGAEARGSRPRTIPENRYRGSELS